MRRVENSEYCYSKECTLGFYLSNDAEFQPDKDTLLGTATIPQITGKRTKPVS